MTGGLHNSQYHVEVYLVLHLRGMVERPSPNYIGNIVNRQGHS